MIVHNLVENSRNIYLHGDFDDRIFLSNFNDFLIKSWNQRNALYDDGIKDPKQHFINVDIKGGRLSFNDYIGTVCYQNHQINVFPKVFKEDEKEDTSNWSFSDFSKNLLVWISYASKFNFPSLNFESVLGEQTSLFELFVSLYSHFVNEAVQKRPFYRYENVVDELSRPKGRPNLRGYYLNNVPRANFAKIECEFTEFKFDNLLNAIIKTTCNHLIKITENGKSIALLRRTLDKLIDVDDKKCIYRDCDKIKLNKLQNHYQAILSLSKMFLMNKEANFNFGNSNAFCFLFPTDMLFEGFIGGFIQEEFNNIGSTRLQTANNYLCDLYVDGAFVKEAFMLREDILFENENGIIVLDTKYKNINRLSNAVNNSKLDILDADIKQMAIYGLKREAKRLCLIYPLRKNEKPENIKIMFNIKFTDRIEKIPLYIIKVPFIFEDNSFKKSQFVLREILEGVLM